MQKDASRNKSQSRHVGSDVGAHSRVLQPIFCSLKGLFDASDLRKQPLFL